MQRFRLRYAKRGRSRFISHRDFARAFERALRRAGVPMAFSSGFTPHPRISYANAVPTGVASEAEYLEIGVAQRCDPQRLREALDAALPDGLAVIELVEAANDTLADHLQVSAWRIELGASTALASAVPDFLVRETLLVQRMTKRGLRDFDTRAATLQLQVQDEQSLELVLRHEVPQVRPDDVVRALAGLAGIDLDPAVLRMTRTAQGEWDGHRISDPLDSSRGV